MALIVPRQTINNQGISGNAHVVNIAGDYNMCNNDGLGTELHTVLESIEQRLKVVDDKGLGTSASHDLRSSILIVMR